MSDSITVLHEADAGTVRRGIAAALERALGANEEPEAESPGAIALPVPEAGAIGDAQIVIALDAGSLERAARARVPMRLAVFPFLRAEWRGELDADLVLVPHEALVADVVALGARRDRVRVCGPIAPEGWSPAEAPETLRERLGLGAEPCAVVRAHALERDDLAPSLVQLSLVRRDVRWLFDVGSDPDLAKRLRDHVPGYGLDALMFADGPDALDAYRAADAVLGRIGGAETSRALATGAALVFVPPRRDELRLAHIIEEGGLADIADSAATLAVTLDAALRDEALEAGKEASLGLDAAGGAARAIEMVRDLARGELEGARPTGLPVGLERLGDPDQTARPKEASAPERDPSVDEELAALREKLGL